MRGLPNRLRRQAGVPIKRPMVAHPATAQCVDAARSRQGAIGLALAGLIVAGWAAAHVVLIFVVALSWANAIPLVTLLLLQTWLYAGLFIVAHDAMHGSLAPGQPRVNAAVGASLLFLYAGFSWRKMRDAHYAHHRHAGRVGDPDFAADHPRSFWRWYGVFLQRYFGPVSVIFVTAVFWLYHLAFGVSVAKMLLFYALPSIASSFQLFYFGTFRPHRHEGDAPFVDRHRARSNGFGVLASLASCYHFGYHLEHHRRPDVPWWGLPGARRAGVGE